MHYSLAPLNELCPTERRYAFFPPQTFDSKLYRGSAKTQSRLAHVTANHQRTHTTERCDRRVRAMGNVRRRDRPNRGRTGAIVVRA